MQKTVLIVGADGFIGRHIASHFRGQGDTVIACARRTKRLSRMGYQTLRLNLLSLNAQSPDFWKEKLQNVDVVIYAAGLLNGSADHFKAVHVVTPKVIFENRPEGCNALMLSAVGIDDADTDFAKYRRAGEEISKQAGATILRAGLVLAETSYGGSSLARGLAALPLVTPVIGKGDQEFNPIHASDLAGVIDHLTRMPHEGTFEVGGSETVSQADMIGKMRGWLGLRKTRRFHLSNTWAMRLGKLGDLMRLGPISQTAVAQLDAGVLAQTRLPSDTPTPRGYSSFLHARPAGTQDLWHARLYLLRPVLRLALAFLWIVSGLLGLFLPPETFLPLLQSDLISDTQAIAFARAGGLVDLLIAGAILRGWRPKLMVGLQTLMVASYTLAFTILAPVVWLLPLGGLLKNLPILALLAVSYILEDER